MTSSNGSSSSSSSSSRRNGDISSSPMTSNNNTNHRRVIIGQGAPIHVPRAPSTTLHVKDIIDDDDDDDYPGRGSNVAGNISVSRDSVFRRPPPPPPTTAPLNYNGNNNISYQHHHHHGRATPPTASRKVVIGDTTTTTTTTTNDVDVRQQHHHEQQPYHTTNTTTTTTTTISESNAHEILLSLSTSFDRALPDDDTASATTTTATNSTPTAAMLTRRTRQREVRGSENNNSSNNDVRPASPEGPPRIQHYHKLLPSDTFEPLPSPVKPDHSLLEDGTATTIHSSHHHTNHGHGRTPSYTTLFNTSFNNSFDMNLEGLLGTDASFGFGPTGSLSFGLGIDNNNNANSSNSGGGDYGDALLTTAPHSLPHAAQRWKQQAHQHASRMSPVRMMASDDDDDDDEPIVTSTATSSTVPLPKLVKRTSPRRRKEGEGSVGEVVTNNGMSTSTACNIQVLTASDNVSSTSSIMIDGVAGGIVVMSGETLSKKQKRLVEDYGKGMVETTTTTSAEKYHDDRSTRLNIKKVVDKTGLFDVLHRHSSIFDKFTFLFPGARDILLSGRSCSTNNNGTLISHSTRKEKYDQSNNNPMDREVAFRRVNAALCAFGGEAILASRRCDRSSSDYLIMSYVVQSEKQRQYREVMLDRFYENDARLSWENEEDPPIDWSVSDDENEEKDESSDVNTKPFQRNIGVMVYPAVNAFTAIEPGIITPALSDMNNSLNSNNNASVEKKTPDKTMEESNTTSSSNDGTTSLSLPAEVFPPTVSPDSVSSGKTFFTFDGKTPQRSVNYAGGAWISNQQSPTKITPGQVTPGVKQSDPNQNTDLLFVDAQELLPEQYRLVNDSKRSSKRKFSSLSHNNNNSDDIRFLYPALPLPYGQRKRISNAMFAMSKTLPGLTDECATVLDEARRRNVWDYAVAQLMTQVVVVTHCTIEDCRLDGLSNYLLTLGIAC